MVEKRESIYAQIITAYGIMTAMVIITVICSYRANGLEYQRLVAIVSNAYAPTSISFLATGLFDFEFIKEKKVVNSVYVTLTVCTALFYAAFSCLDSAEGKATVVFAVLSVVFSFGAVLIIVIHATVLLTTTTRKRKTSDGMIVGRSKG